MDFTFFGTGQHKIDAENFLKNPGAVLLDDRASEKTTTVKLCLEHYMPVIEIPFHELPSRHQELPKNKFIGIFCSRGVRSAIAFAYLKSKGLEDVKMIEGGYNNFMDAILPGKVFKQIKK